MEQERGGGAAAWNKWRTETPPSLSVLQHSVAVPHFSAAPIPRQFDPSFIYKIIHLFIRFFFFLKSWVAWPGVCTETALKSGGGGGGY